MKLTNKYGLPEAFENFYRAQRAEYDLKRNFDTISVTELIDAPHLRKLKLLHGDDIELDITDQFYSVMGTAIHNMLEMHDDSHIVNEVRFTSKLFGKYISGKVDRWVIKHKSVEDFKTLKTAAYKFNKDGKPEWEQQLNVNAYLMKMEGLPVEQLKIHMIFRDFDDIASLKSQNPDNFGFSIDIPMWPEQKTLDFIQERVEYHNEIMKNPSIGCTAEERWSRPDEWLVQTLKGNTVPYGKKETKEEAEAFLASRKAKGKDGKVVFRAGIDMRCSKYCDYAKICPFMNPDMKPIEMRGTDENDTKRPGTFDF